MRLSDQKINQQNAAVDGISRLSGVAKGWLINLSLLPSLSINNDFFAGSENPLNLVLKKVELIWSPVAPGVLISDVTLDILIVILFPFDKLFLTVG